MTGNRCLGIVLLASAGALAQGSTALSQATKVPGLVQEGSYDPGNLGMQMQQAPQNDDTGAVYAVGPWPTYTRPLAEGEGMQPPLPGATWEHLVSKMINTFGAPIPAPEAKAIVAYLKRHYTPETRKE